MTSTSILPSAGAAGPARVAALAVTLRSRVERAALAVWRALEASGNARAMRELRILRDGWQPIDPVQAQHLHAAIAFLASEAGEGRAAAPARSAPSVLAPHR